MGIEAVNPFELPLINTVILLSSGFTVTYAHHSLIQGNRKGTLDGLVYTVGLALIFTAFQAVEYSVSFFSISDGTFGSCFYFGTGFHGLTLCVAPILNEQKTNKDGLVITVPVKKSEIINSYFIKREFLE
jgi:cytochrome c oxidase subunit 3